MKKNNKIYIIGGGPAGISVAYYLSKKNIKFQLFEASSELGGNCKTFKVDDFYFDSGAHRFHDKDEKSSKIVKLIMGNELKLINAPSQIFVQNKVVYFPLSPFSLIKFFGFATLLIEFFRLILIKIKHSGTISNFKDFAVHTYGRKISSTFLLNYSEKLWGLPPEKLSVEISGKRLKGLDIKSLFFELVGLQGKKNKHLDGSFYYPQNGIGSIFKKLSHLAGIENFKINKNITKIYHENDKITSIKINDSEKINVDFLVSSIPLDKLILGLYPKPPENIINSVKLIDYRDLILVIFLLNKEFVNNNGSMYFPSKEYAFTRIFEPKNRSKLMSPPNRTSLVVEVPISRNKMIFEENKLIKEVRNQLIDLGFFKKQEITKIELKKIFNAYPILDSGYHENLKPIKKYLKKFKNLILNGRNGKYEYNHIHDHIKDGRYISSIIDEYMV